MNSKGEFNGSKLPRIVIEIGEDVETEDYRNGMKEYEEREQKKSESRKREENKQVEEPEGKRMKRERVEEENEEKKNPRTPTTPGLIPKEETKEEERGGPPMF